MSTRIVRIVVVGVVAASFAVGYTTGVVGTTNAANARLGDDACIGYWLGDGTDGPESCEDDAGLLASSWRNGYDYGVDAGRHDAAETGMERDALLAQLETLSETCVMHEDTSATCNVPNGIAAVVWSHGFAVCRPDGTEWIDTRDYGTDGCTVVYPSER